MNDRTSAQQLAAVQESLPLESNSANFESLIALGKILKEHEYRFVTVTPLTHQRVNARSGNEWASSLTDVFGWSRAYKTSGTESFALPEIRQLMQTANIVRLCQDGEKSTLRASTLEGNLYFHSAYPTDAPDSVFFGPDTYRFARQLRLELDGLTDDQLQRVRRAVDIGCGAGPGAMTIAASCPEAEVFGVDINSAALHLTGVNARLAGLTNVVPFNSNLLNDLPGQFDLIISNPPYLVDRDQRKYRHGGGPLGAGLSLAVVETALQRLSPHGTLLLYTGAAIVDGEDLLLKELKNRLSGNSVAWSYEEIDPDVFGEELDEVAYAKCDRIAAVWLTIRMT